MDLGLNGRTAYITGGGGGIGRAVGRVLASQGAKVGLLDVSEDALSAAKAEIDEQVPGAQVATAIADVTTAEGVASSMAALAEEIGSCDILVNNAGFARDKYLLKMEEADWDDVHNVVLKGAFHCCRAALPGMMERKWGRIVNMSSLAYLGNKGQTNYSAAKAGLVGMTNALARESGGFNITVNAIAPGLVATPRVKARPDFADLEKRFKAMTPLQRLIEVDDIAKAVAFFASSMADCVSAQCLSVTNGA